MNKTMNRRLDRIKQQIAPNEATAPFAGLLEDELEVCLLDCCNQLLASEPGVEDTQAAYLREHVARIKKAISDTARKQDSAEYQRHQQWLEASWRQRQPNVPYVRSLFDLAWGYEDWDKPNVMNRRQALRDRPDIAALIAQAPIVAGTVG